jgi:pimeloyl-ACP methyl ester carboxylesterase
MAAVFLHGNPETPAVWDPLLAALTRTDVVCPALPGFGCATPSGFGATKEEYAEWFTGELESVAASSGPVDLVGHDWGGAIAMHVAARRPDLIRTWASDILGVFHPDYEWHQFAQIWQTPGDGEAFFEQNLATPVADRVAVYEQIGIPRATAQQFVAAGDAEMGRCVLALYRSAAQPAMVEWGRQLQGAATRPGLAVIAPDDPFVRSVDLAPVVAESLGARQQVLDGQGHWWMLSDPQRGAAVLTEFWGSV